MIRMYFSDVEAIRREHRAAMLYLLRCGMRTDDIKRLRLDDPRLSESDRVALVSNIQNEREAASKPVPMDWAGIRRKLDRRPGVKRT